MRERLASRRNPSGLPVAVAVLLSVLLFACTGGTTLSEEAGPDVGTTPHEDVAAEAESLRGVGGTLKVFAWQAPTTLNPHMSAGTKDLLAARVTLEPLASFDAQGRMVPILAAEEPTRENGDVAPDGRSVTWRLKRGVQWSDGEPFTAHDVAFTFDYIMDPEGHSTSAPEYEAIERIEVVDDHTVVLHFSDVTPAWAAPFTGAQGVVLPRHVFEGTVGPSAAEAPENLRPVGTGPFRVEDFSAEDLLIVGDEAVATTKIVYEANPYYREPDQPFFGRVELRGGGGDANVAAEAVRDGLVDFAWNLAVDETVLADLEKAGEASIDVNLGAFTERIMLNFTDPNSVTAEGERSSVAFPHPFLSDRRVRRAIALAIDREAIAANYGRGGEVTSNLLVAPPDVNSPNTRHEVDLDAAAALLDEAGWTDEDGDGVRSKDGVDLRMLYQTSINPVRQKTQAIVKAGLETIGFDVELKNIDSSIFFGPVRDSTDTRRHFYADLEMYAFSNKSPDAAAYLRGWTCDEAAQMANGWSSSNWARYCNPEYDELYERTTTELDPARRRDLFIALNDLLVEDAAVVPLTVHGIVSGLSTSITGFSATPWDVEVWNLAEWRRR